jgi:hypothetical protein
VLVIAVAMLLVLRLRQSHREAENARAHLSRRSRGQPRCLHAAAAVRGRDGRVSEFIVEDANPRALLLMAVGHDDAVGKRLRTLIPGSCAGASTALHEGDGIRRSRSRRRSRPRGTSTVRAGFAINRYPSTGASR